MNKGMLLGLIKQTGTPVYKVVSEINDMGIPMTTSTFYKGLNNKREFKANEIVALSKVVNLSREEVMDIFFKEMVS
ncbi:hypothetical protein [Leuconostoc falkenbergense]|uniref:hypothetical protein n=1 Tax=Leuconostoc falkenbergense TaxID=2766470 RepID=UPI0024A94606|nr:hypothetical protein [Leuconostoc falkenbergense]MDI6553133.1 hypothetical protein [Leuconostoc falkenbergense]